MLKLLFEACILGFLNVILGLIITYTLKLNKNNDIYTISFTFFLSGFIIHLFCELFGINKSYCKNGNACQ